MKYLGFLVLAVICGTAYLIDYWWNWRDTSDN